MRNNGRTARVAIGAAVVGLALLGGAMLTGPADASAKEREIKIGFINDAYPGAPTFVVLGPANTDDAWNLINITDLGANPTIPPMTAP